MAPRSIVAGALAGSLVVSPAARASEETFWSPGIHLVVSFGQRLRVGLGADLRLTHVTNFAGECEPRHAWQGFGAFGQATWLIHDGVRFAAGLHVAGELEAEGFVLDGELGWSYTIERDWRAHGLQAGIIYGHFPLDLGIGRLNVSFDDDDVRVEGQLGIGARSPGILGADGGSCIIGRPLRVDGEVRLAPCILGRARRVRFGDRETAPHLAASWLEAARAEAASVPAFMALARELTRAGAPRSLVARSWAAARDEVRHARVCSELAGRSAGREVAMLTPATPMGATELRVERLTRLAVESLNDGCLGEGTAAERARRALVECREEPTAAALSRIARDEERHAELAWSVLGFALEAGGRPVRDAVMQAWEAARTVAGGDDEEMRGATRVGRRAWARLGRLDRTSVDKCADAVHERAGRRLQGLRGLRGSLA